MTKVYTVVVIEHSIGKKNGKRNVMKEKDSRGNGRKHTASKEEGLSQVDSKR